MTGAEFTAKEKEVLAGVPEEFREAIFAIAYEDAHAYGFEEVMIQIESLVYDLAPAIAAYTKRLQEAK